jgi:hypothetical protein
MKIEAVKDVTTRESAITYQLTLRLSVWDLKKPESAFMTELNHAVIKAINGISEYAYYD